MVRKSRYLLIGRIVMGLAIIIVITTISCSDTTHPNYPDPLTNPQSPLMLAGEWLPDDPHDLNFESLPKLPAKYALISDVRGAGGTRVNQHNYLVHFGGRYWAMWSDGRGIQRVAPELHADRVPGHDREGQHVSYAFSNDGLQWSEIYDLSGPPAEGFGWIARGFWIKNGKLLALASHFNAPGYRGEGLQLHAFELREADSIKWQHRGLLYDNALNNFPPKKLPSGEWMMSRRDSVGDVHFLVGGTEAYDQWQSFPMVEYADSTLAAEEPYWWVLPDEKNLVGLFRDNRRSGFLYRAFSTDNGRTWTKPVRTNFPDATSKFSGVRLGDGRYLLVSNSNPKQRDPLTLAISDDGLVFRKMGYLVGGRHIDYPHIIEHDGHVLIAFAGAKQTVEVLKIAISDLDDL